MVVVLLHTSPGIGRLSATDSLKRTPSLESIKNEQIISASTPKSSDAAIQASYFENGEINLVRMFYTANSTIRCHTVAGIAYHTPSNHLFLSDSEINQGSYWNCENIFEVPLSGNNLIDSYDAYTNDGAPCPKSTFREPTGITYFNGYFYITDDDRGIIMQHDLAFGRPIDYVQVPSQYMDVEGITCDPDAGLFYAVVGTPIAYVIVYDQNLSFRPDLTFAVNPAITDPEGIAFHSGCNHLFLVSDIDETVYEMELDGEVLKEYDFSSFSPSPGTPQGLTFASSSDPNDDPNNYHIYIGDGNGWVYEAEIPDLEITEPDISVNPTTCNYGVVTVGTSVTRTIVVSNQGNGDLAVSSITLIGTNLNDFTITSGGGGFTLLPSTSRNITVEFHPSSQGSKNGILSISSNDPDESEFIVLLTGTGLKPSEPDLLVNPITHNFNNVLVGANSSYQFTIRNEGYADLYVTATYFSGADADEFSIVSGDAPFTLVSDATHYIRINFSPDSEGDKNAILSIESNDPDENPFEVELYGKGTEIPSCSGYVMHEETQTGGATLSGIVSTSENVMGVPNDLYLAAITVAEPPLPQVISLTGLGLEWVPCKLSAAAEANKVLKYGWHKVWRQVMA